MPLTDILNQQCPPIWLRRVGIAAKIAAKIDAFNRYFESAMPTNLAS
ncbi:MAG: hypothetical protein AB4426_24135 [Xenococcaceae cyanobacterium]